MNTLLESPAPRVLPRRSPTLSVSHWIQRAVLFLGALGFLFVGMVPPVTAGCRYKAFLANGVPFTPTHGELAVNTGVLLSELVLVAAATAMLWLVVGAFARR